MRITILVFICVAVIVIVAGRMIATSQRRNRVVEQPQPVDAEHERRPPSPSEDPGPSAPSGDPVPGSREDRARHNKP